MESRRPVSKPLLGFCLFRILWCCCFAKFFVVVSSSSGGGGIEEPSSSSSSEVKAPRPPPLLSFVSPAAGEEWAPLMPVSFHVQLGPEHGAIAAAPRDFELCYQGGGRVICRPLDDESSELEPVEVVLETAGASKLTAWVQSSKHEGVGGVAVLYVWADPLAAADFFSNRQRRSTMTTAGAIYVKILSPKLGDDYSLVLEEGSTPTPGVVFRKVQARIEMGGVPKNKNNEDNEDCVCFQGGGGGSSTTKQCLPHTGARSSVFEADIAVAIEEDGMAEITAWRAAGAETCGSSSSSFKTRLFLWATPLRAMDAIDSRLARGGGGGGATTVDDLHAALAVAQAQLALQASKYRNVEAERLVADGGVGCDGDGDTRYFCSYSVGDLVNIGAVFGDEPSEAMWSNVVARVETVVARALPDSIVTRYKRLLFESTGEAYEIAAREPDLAKLALAVDQYAEGAGTAPPLPDELVVHLRSGDFGEVSDAFVEFFKTHARDVRYGRITLLAGSEYSKKDEKLTTLRLARDVERLRRAAPGMRWGASRSADEDLAYMRQASTLLVHRGGFSLLGAILTKGSVLYTEECLPHRARERGGDGVASEVLQRLQIALDSKKSSSSTGGAPLFENSENAAAAAAARVVLTTTQQAAASSFTKSSSSPAGLRALVVTEPAFGSEWQQDLVLSLSFNALALDPELRSAIGAETLVCVEAIEESCAPLLTTTHLPAVRAAYPEAVTTIRASVRQGATVLAAATVDVWLDADEAAEDLASQLAAAQKNDELELSVALVVEEHGDNVGPRLVARARPYGRLKGGHLLCYQAHFAEFDGDVDCTGDDVNMTITPSRPLVALTAWAVNEHALIIGDALWCNSTTAGSEEEEELLLLLLDRRVAAIQGVLARPSARLEGLAQPRLTLCLAEAANHLRQRQGAGTIWTNHHRYGRQEEDAPHLDDDDDSSTTTTQEEALRGQSSSSRRRGGGASNNNKTAEEEEEEEEYRKRPVLLFIAGLEGTGHHWWKSVLEHAASGSGKDLVGFPGRLMERLYESWGDPSRHYGGRRLAREVGLCGYLRAFAVEHSDEARLAWIQTDSNLASWPFAKRRVQNKPDLLGIVDIFEHPRAYCESSAAAALPAFRVKIIWSTRRIERTMVSTTRNRYFAPFLTQARWLEHMLVHLHAQIAALPLCAWTRVQYDQDLMWPASGARALAPRLSKWLGLPADRLDSSFANRTRDVSGAVSDLSETERAILEDLFGPARSRLWPLATRPVGDLAECTAAPALARQQAPPIALTVTVCVPCVPRHFRFLPALVEDLRAQTFQPFEVILAVSETAPDVARQMERELGVVVLEVADSQTPGENKNRCVAAAQGEVVSFFDADDRMHPRRLEIVRQSFLGRSVACLLHSHRHDYEAGRVDDALAQEISQKNTAAFLRGRVEEATVMLGAAFYETYFAGGIIGMRGDGEGDGHEERLRLRRFVHCGHTSLLRDVALAVPFGPMRYGEDEDQLRRIFDRYGRRNETVLFLLGAELSLYRPSWSRKLTVNGTTYVDIHQIDETTIGYGGSIPAENN